MNFSKACMLCLIAFISAELSAQHSRVMLYPNQDSLEWVEAKRVITSFDPLSLIQGLSTVNRPSRVEVINEKGAYLAWEDCNLNVYRWKDAQWINTYKYNNYGYFCDGYPMFWNDQLHLLGGNGLVNYHTDLLIFEEALGSWEFVATKFQPLDYNTPFVGTGEKGAFSFFGKKFNLRNGLEAPWEDGYYLDLSSKTWFEIKLNWLRPVDQDIISKLQPINIDLKDFQLMKLSDGWLVFQKSDYKLLHLPGSDLELDNPSFWVAEENSLTWKNKGQEVKKVQISQLLPKAIQVAEGEIIPVKSEKVRTLQMQTILIAIFFLGLVAILLLRLYRKRKKIQKSVPVVEEEVIVDEENDEGDTLWKRILTMEGQIFSTVQLDEFLQINSINPENRKAKRSRLIKSFNERAKSEFGREIIFRERDPDDKRFFRFRIETKK
jgi:hypothetical protein